MDDFLVRQNNFEEIKKRLGQRDFAAYFWVRADKFPDLARRWPENAAQFHVSGLKGLFKFVAVKSIL